MTASPAQLDAAAYLGNPVNLPVTYNKKDLLIYAVGIGCDEERFTYELNKDFEAFPTFPISLFFKGDSSDAHVMAKHPIVIAVGADHFPGVPYGLDGERYIERVEPLPLEGGRFFFKNEFTALIRKGKAGAVSEYRTNMEDEQGKVYYKFWSSWFSSTPKMPEFQDAGQSGAEKVEVLSRAPDATEQYKTSPVQNLMYRLTGDLNDAHVDTRVAQKMKFPEGKPILQGCGFLGIAARAVLKHYGQNQAKAFRSMRVRFSKTVTPGQTLETRMWLAGAGAVSGTKRIVFDTVCVENGGTVINNAYMDLWEAEMGGSSSKL